MDDHTHTYTAINKGHDTRNAASMRGRGAFKEAMDILYTKTSRSHFSYNVFRHIVFRASRNLAASSNPITRQSAVRLTVIEVVIFLPTKHMQNHHLSRQKDIGASTSDNISSVICDTNLQQEERNETRYWVNSTEQIGVYNMPYTCIQSREQDLSLLSGSMLVLPI